MADELWMWLWMLSGLAAFYYTTPWWMLGRSPSGHMLAIFSLVFGPLTFGLLLAPHRWNDKPRDSIRKVVG